MPQEIHTASNAHSAIFRINWSANQCFGSITAASAGSAPVCKPRKPASAAGGKPKSSSIVEANGEKPRVAMGGLNRVPGGKSSGTASPRGFGGDALAAAEGGDADAVAGRARGTRIGALQLGHLPERPACSSGARNCLPQAVH